MRSYLGLASQCRDLKLFKNMKDGTFRDVTKEVGLDKVFMPMGANFGDIDNDGYLDIYLGTGNPSYASLLPNVMLRNQDGKFFTDVTASSGTGELHKGHGVAFADIDNDGDEDLLAQIGGATPGDSHAFRLFENPGNGNDWINLHLVGVKSNRAAIGARIKLTVAERGQAHSAPSIARSAAEDHSGLRPWPSISGWENRRASSSWKSGGRPAIPGRIYCSVGKNQFLEDQGVCQELQEVGAACLSLRGRESRCRTATKVGYPIVRREG